MEVLEVVLYAHNTLVSSSTPNPLVFLKLFLHVVFDDLVDGLHLAVCLRMINRREAFLDAEIVVEFSELFVVKLHAIV